MKIKKLLEIGILTLLCSFIASFFIVCSFFNIFYEFELITVDMLLLLTNIVSISLSVINTICIVACTWSDKKTKFWNWIDMNRSKSFLTYLLLFLFFASVRSEVFLSVDKMKDMIYLEWTIFGISVAVFLIWNAVIIKYLQSKKPQKSSLSIPSEMLEYLHKKGDFYSYATSLFDDSYLLILNLFFICLSTVLIYVTTKEANIFYQSLVVFTLFLCTNTISALIIDILKLFNEDKKKILSGTKTTNNDIELENSIYEQAIDTLIICKGIDKLENIDENERDKIKSEIIEKYFDGFKDKLN